MNHNQPYTVLALIEAKSGKEQIVKEALIALIAPTLQEKGCLNYDFHICSNNPTQFMIYENWVHQEDHAKHMEASHIKACIAKIEGLLAKPLSITFWQGSK